MCQDAEDESRYCAKPVRLINMFESRIARVRSGNNDNQYLNNHQTDFNLCSGNERLEDKGLFFMPYVHDWSSMMLPSGSRT